MISEQEILSALRTAFPEAEHIAVRDTTGGMDHFDAVVVSARFESLSRVKQHQAVYAALGDAMKQRIHALALQTLTPAAWHAGSGT